MSAQVGKPFILGNTGGLDGPGLVDLFVVENAKGLLVFGFSCLF